MIFRYKVGKGGIKNLFFMLSSLISMKFQLLIKNIMLKINTFLAFKCSDVVFIMLIDVKCYNFLEITFLARNRHNFAIYTQHCHKRHFTIPKYVIH